MQIVHKWSGQLDCQLGWYRRSFQLLSLAGDKSFFLLSQRIAEDEMGEIMAVKHKDFAVYGVQFHPESILTPQGQTILANFLT